VSKYKQQWIKKRKGRYDVLSMTKIGYGALHERFSRSGMDRLICVDEIVTVSSDASIDQIKARPRVDNVGSAFLLVAS
jgi:hypothetical protein